MDIIYCNSPTDVLVKFFRTEPEHNMMTSSNGNIFRVTGPLCGELTGHRWITSTKANDAELIYAWTHGWANNRDAGGLRRHRAGYDVTVMSMY